MAKNGNGFKGNGLESLGQVKDTLNEAIAERDAGRVTPEPVKAPLTPEEKATRSRVGRIISKAPQDAPVAPTSVEGTVGVVRNKKTGEVLSVSSKTTVATEVPNQDADTLNDYDTLIGNVVRKPLSTGPFSKNAPENIRAFERTMLALIPKVGGTAGFHAMLEKSKVETSKLSTLTRSLKEARAKGTDTFEFEFGGKKETLTLEQANQRLSETKTKLEAGRSDLQDRADTLLRDEKVFATAQQLREKTVENADKVLRQKLSSAKTEEEKLDIQNDSVILEGALNHLHTFKPNGGLETFGHEKRARFANTHSAIQEIYKKYGIRPATEDDLKPVKPRTPKVVAPEPVASAEKPLVAPVESSVSPAPETMVAEKKRTPRKKKVMMTAGDLGQKEEEMEPTPIGVGLDGRGINRRKKNPPLEAPSEPFGVGLEGDGVIEKTPVGVGLEGDTYQDKKESFEVLQKKPGTELVVTNPQKAVALLQKKPGTELTVIPNPENAITLSPGQIARIEAHKGALAKQAERINTEAEKKGFGATMNRIASWYNKQPMWKKVGMGLTFTTIGVGGMMAGGAVGGTAAAIAFGAGRIYGTFGTWAMLNGATSKMKNRERAGLIQGAGTAAAFFLLPKLAQWIDMQTGAGQWLAEKFGLVQTPQSQITQTPTNPSPVPPTGGPSVSISKGDTVWGVVEKGLGSRAEFSGLDRAGKDLAIDTYIKKMGGMTPDQLKALGFSSGDINKIQIGEKIQLPVMQDQALFDKAVTDAKALTPEQKVNILKYRAGIISGGLETAAYVPPTPEVSVPLENNVSANYKDSLDYIFGNRQDRYTKFVSWKNPDYFINASNYTPDVIAQETRMQGVEIERLRDTLYQYKKAGLTGRTVEQLLQAGARSRAGL